MSAELRAWVLAAAAAEPAPTRAAVKRRNILISMLAAASGVAAFVIFALLTSQGQLVRFGGGCVPYEPIHCGIAFYWCAFYQRILCFVSFPCDAVPLRSPNVRL